MVEVPSLCLRRWVMGPCLPLGGILLAAAAARSGYLGLNRTVTGCSIFSDDAGIRTLPPPPLQSTGARCLVLGARMEDDAGQRQEDAEEEKESRLCESHKVRPSERSRVCGAANRSTALSVFIHHT